MAGAKALKKKGLKLSEPNTQPLALPYAQAYSMRDFGIPASATNFFSPNMPASLQPPCPAPLAAACRAAADV